MQRWMIVATLAMASIFAGARPAGAQDAVRREPMPTLARTLELARARAPEVVASQGRLGVSRAGYEGARLSSVGNPYVEIYSDRGASTRDVTVQGSIWLPLDVSGQRGRRMAEVDALIAWDRTNLDTVRGLAAGDAINAYSEVVVGAERVRAFELIAGTSRAEAEVYNARLVAGDASLQDAKFAEVELAKNLVSLAESRADLTRALAVLARMTGADLYGPPAGAPYEPPPPSGGLDHAALAARGATHSPLVVAGQREAEYFDRAAARQERESHAPLSVIVGAGRGDLGEARVGGGLAWTLPILRTNQGEVARAKAESTRALESRDVQRLALRSLLRARFDERITVREAIGEVVTSGEPAARQAVDAALEMARAGKSELLRVLIARRDLATLVGRKLDLIRREWSIVADVVAITGELP